MTENDYLIAKNLKKKLSTMVNIVDFRIFGSRARGDEEDDSDMDVFIEVEYLNKKLKEKIRDIIWEVGFEHFIFISTLIFTRYEIEDSPLRASSIVKNIYDQGIQI